jgi:hypothetical protein
VPVVGQAPPGGERIAIGFCADGGHGLPLSTQLKRPKSFKCLLSLFGGAQAGVLADTPAFLDCGDEVLGVTALTRITPGEITLNCGDEARGAVALGRVAFTRRDP